MNLTKWARIFVWALFIIIATRLSLGSSRVLAADCEVLEPWLDISRIKMADSATHAERVAQSQNEFAARTDTAEKLEQIYAKENLDKATFDACLIQSPIRQNFLETFYYALFSHSLESLRSAQSPSIRAMMKLFDAKYGAGIPIFRVTGSFQEQDDTPLPAGFHRATGSIYMDFASIHPDDWLIIFVHETLHALDDQIMKGVEGYAEPGEAQHFASLTSLSPKDETELDTWLTFGLDRGLLAEYRAWSATFEIYEQGLQENLWSKRGWLENVLNQRGAGEKLDDFAYRYLDAHSADPTDGIFSRPLISSELKDLRVKLSKNPPSLDGLAPIVR